MSDEGEATVARRPHAVHVRVRAGMRKPAQLAPAGQVLRGRRLRLRGEPVPCSRSASRCFGAHHLVAATAAFVVAVVNNFWWNRHWTFDARGGPRRLPGAALLRRQHRRLPGGGYHPRGARERRRRARAARPGDRDRRCPRRSTSSGTRFGASRSRCRGTEGGAGSGALRRAASRPRRRRRPSCASRRRRRSRRASSSAARSEVIGLAERGEKVVREERRGGRLDPTAYIEGPRAAGR